MDLLSTVIVRFVILALALISISDATFDPSLDRGVEFYVITEGQPLEAEKVVNSLGETSGFHRYNGDEDSIWPVVVLLHGLGGSFDSICNINIAKGLLTRGGLNVIAADYQPLVVGSDYAEVAGNVNSIGFAVGNFLLKAFSDRSVSPSNTTLVGFSLGAHVAGVAGQMLKDNSFHVHKIIGLDPAKPGFINLSSEEKLDVGDADFVMAIHTAGGFIGIENPIGDADFYPNGGKEIQPICLGNGILTLICSHQAACTYLVDSITTGGLMAEKCSSWESFVEGHCSTHEKAVMGIDTDVGTRGTFYLTTNASTSSFLVDSLGSRKQIDNISTESKAIVDPDLEFYRHFPRASASSLKTYSPLSIFFPSVVSFSRLLLRFYSNDNWHQTLRNVQLRFGD